ncbi:ATP-grasp fold amidoligase family protein [Kocuria rhizosphaericola]|uniref:ATP-grasp fold amidoligase family protein n=1 Tax=Kocuria rhizosphaericola TaxID=3376284 RepID=UPI003789AA84
MKGIEMFSFHQAGQNSVQAFVRPAYHWLRNKLPLATRRRLVHARNHHRLLRLENPQTFNEKISWRMVYDRREELSVTCDKKAMKILAADRAADLVRIPRTIWSGTDLNELEIIKLPEYWVLKPNHRSGLVHIGRGIPNMVEIKTATVGWLDEINWSVHGEWAYSRAERTLLVEEHIGTPGEVPIDYKFEVFDGVVRAAWVYLDRFKDFRGFMVDRNFQRLAVQGEVNNLRIDEVVGKPPNYERMVQAAERIAKGFDYMRVDLYDTGDHVWFGETTPYSANGNEVFQPAWFDYTLGSYWTLPRIH